MNTTTTHRPRTTRDTTRLARKGAIEFNAYLLIIVTLVLFAILGTKLYNTLGAQQITIGQKQATVVETYQNAQILQFLEQSGAREAVDRATRDFISTSGLDTPECGRSGSHIRWNTANQTCVPTHEYQVYYDLLDTHVHDALHAIDQAQHTDLDSKSYQYYADEDRVVGIPDKPEPLPIHSRNDPVPVTLLGIRIGTIPGGVRANLGWYYWNPTFQIRTHPGITDIARMRVLYDAIQTQCDRLAPDNQTTCIEHQAEVTGLDGTQVTPAPDQYYRLTIPSTAILASGPAAPYRIAIHLDAPRPQDNAPPST